jgi:hypothetical protein
MLDRDDATDDVAGDVEASKLPSNVLWLVAEPGPSLCVSSACTTSGVEASIGHEMPLATLAVVRF